MSFSVGVDPTNPGQFFACCGLLELADRLWPGGAQGTFSSTGYDFHLARTHGTTADDADELLGALAQATVTSSMTAAETARLKQLKNLNKKLRTPETDAETEHLSALWERERLCVPVPRVIWLDWWSDERSGGNRFKTWAGKQLVSEITAALQRQLRAPRWRGLSPSAWLSEPAEESVLPLYFDAAIGAQASSLDVGFSLDSLDMGVQTKPLLELAALVGLQRFRPWANVESETFTYTAWTEPAAPVVAAAMCAGSIDQSGGTSYEFRLLYRTKYLKSFLPAVPRSPRGIR